MPHANLTFILGGARSGKSRHAETLITRHPPPWTYVATADAWDDEMRARIATHRARRGAGWTTLEAPRDLAGPLATPTPVLIDCLTLWLTNLLLASIDIGAETRAVVTALTERTLPTVIVSNEVGLGIVPENALARRFRDEAGVLHQRIAEIASHVVLMVAGLPVIAKAPT